MNSGKHAFRIAAFAVLGIMCAAVLIFVLFRQGEKSEPFLAPVITVQPARGRLEKTIRISSQVETGRLITVVSRTGGTLILLDAQPGKKVSENEIIAQVDSAPYDLAYLQAQSAFFTARSTYERVSVLYNNQATTRQNYEEVRTTYEAARAQYELARLNLDYTKVRSPIDGVVLIKHSTEGGLVDSGTPLVTLGDLDDIRIKVAVPELHYRLFAETWETMPVSMTVPALGDDETESFVLEPVSLAPYVSPENRSFLVEYRVPGGAEQSLRPGMFVNVSFVIERRENVYYLPFRVASSGNRLWYAGKDGRAGYIEFAPEFFNDDFFQIPEELGDRTFIIEGQHFLTAGQELTILVPDSNSTGYK
ncbi:MAG: efflux RND transporter periplasmic adaptor subunit [Spirochaetaceae bacterium]|jgi:RND family efflux transporter MFP subunit|nr:efflux RND transporter periplasmic adaptor subunit [Spirochaetaceae bacterium]